jgi:thioesterase domain-containing protein
MQDNEITTTAYKGMPSVIVPIQPQGSRPPFFCVHPVGGGVFCYRALARHLGSEQPFYGLQARDLIRGQEPHADIETMAADYLEALRSVQPAGPYRLGGWSLGGVTAFEMAQQLRRQGQSVALLTLIDSVVPSLLDQSLARSTNHRSQRTALILRETVMSWRCWRSCAAPGLRRRSRMLLNKSSARDFCQLK